jgi:DNA-binding transcriptional ArsR family regulator
MTYQPADSLILDNLEALKVYFDPLRMQIVQEISHQCKNVHEIAEALEVPFTRLYYHIKMLEKHGIIQVVETRAMSGAVEEKYYQIAAKQFIVDRSLLTLATSEGQNPALDILLETMLRETGENIRRSVREGNIDLKTTAPNPTALMIRRGVLRLNQEQATQLYHELEMLLNRFVSVETTRHDPYYEILISLYPTHVATPAQDDGENDLK